MMDYSRLTPLCKDTLFDSLPEPMRSIGYRVHICKQPYKYIADRTGLSENSIEAISEDALLAALRLMIDSNVKTIKEPLQKYEVDE